MIKTRALNFIHLSLEFFVVIVCGFSVFFTIFSELPQKYQILQQSAYCTKAEAAELNKQYFAYEAAFQPPTVKEKYDLVSDGLTAYYGCKSDLGFMQVPRLIQFHQQIYNYTFYLTYGFYNFTAAQGTQITIEENANVVQKGETLKIEVPTNETRRVIINDTHRLEVQFYNYDTSKCDRIEQIGSSVYDHIVAKRDVGTDEELIFTIVGETPYYDTAYIAMFTFLGIAILMQAEIVVYLIMRLKRRVQNNSRVAGLTEFIESNMI